jgi:hypothetical protein
VIFFPAAAGTESGHRSTNRSGTGCSVADPAGSGCHAGLRDVSDDPSGRDIGKVLFPLS